MRTEQELRVELARRIDTYVGPSEKRETEIPGLTLVRLTTATCPACLTYEPSVAVIAQGRKRVELGSKTFVYDESRYLLTSVDLPIRSQVLDASEERPFLAVALRFEMTVVRELIGREEMAGYFSLGDYSRTNFVRAVRGTVPVEGRVNG